MSLQCKISEEMIVFEGRHLRYSWKGVTKSSRILLMGVSYREAPEVDGQVYIENDTDSQPGDM